MVCINGYTSMYRLFQSLYARETERESVTKEQHNDWLLYQFRHFFSTNFKKIFKGKEKK